MIAFVTVFWLELLEALGLDLIYCIFFISLCKGSSRGMKRPLENTFSARGIVGEFTASWRYVQLSWANGPLLPKGAITLPPQWQLFSEAVQFAVPVGHGFLFLWANEFSAALVNWINLAMGSTFNECLKCHKESVSSTWSKGKARVR